MDQLIKTIGTKQLESNLFLTLKTDGLYVHTRKALHYARLGRNQVGGEYVTRCNSKAVVNFDDISQELWDEFNNAPTLLQYKIGKRS
jgi:hypothetical protein